MKILYLHQYYVSPKMKGGTRSYEIGRRFVMWGHSVEMVTTDHTLKKNNGWYTTEEAGMHIHWQPIPYSNKMKFNQRIKTFIEFAIKAAIYSLSLDVDVVFATSTPLTIAIPGLIVARIKNIPLVFEVRDLWPEVPIEIGALKNSLVKVIAKWFERFVYHHSNSIVALSPGMAKGVLATGYPSNRLIIAPNSCDIALFRLDKSEVDAFRYSFPWLGERYLIAYTGTLGYANDVSFLVDVANEMSKILPEVRFLVVGDGAEWEKIETKANKYGILGKSFFMMKSIPKQDIVKVICAATVMTSLFRDLPSLEANSANKFFDALAAGCPVAINYGGWQKELILETGAGIIIEREPLLASKTLAKFLLNDIELKKAAESALRLAKDRFDRDNIAKSIEQLIVKTVKKSREYC